MRRRLTRALGYLGLTLVAVILTALVAIETPWFKERVRAFAVQWSAQYLTGQLSIGRLSGSLLRGVTLENVSLLQDGRPVMAAGAITIQYDPLVLARRKVAFADITIRRADVRLTQDETGWNMTRLLKPLNSVGPPVDFAIASIQLVESEVTIATKGRPERHLADVDFEGRLVRSGGRLTVGLSRLRATDESSGFRVTEMAGTFNDAFDELDIAFAAASPNARVNGRAVAKAGDPVRRVDIRAEVTDFDVSTVNGDPRWKTLLTGQATAAIAMPPTPGQYSVNFGFTGPHASGFGYEGRAVDAKGEWRNGRLAFEARSAAYGARAAIKAAWQGGRFSGSGTFRDLDMRRLPAHLELPKFASRLGGSYRIQVDPSAWNADVTLDRSMFEDAVIGSGTIGHLEVGGGAVTYTARGELADFNVRRIAGPLDVPLLAADRFESRLSGSFHAEGTAGGPDTRTLTAGASLTAATLSGARLDGVEVTASLAGPRLDMSAKGPFEHVTAHVAGLPESVTLDASGTADVRVALDDVGAPIDVGNIDVEGWVDLARSDVQGLDVTQARFAGALTDGMLELREATVTAAGVDLAATGTLALGETGESALSVTAGIEDLSPIGERAGRPLSGAANIAGKVTGSWAHPKATGKLNARQLAYGETATALTLSSTFSAALPERQIEKLVVETKSEGTFLRVGDFDLVRWSGTAAYRARQLDVDAHLEETARQVDVAGIIGLETEARRITIRNLALTTAGTLWSLPADREANVALEADRVRIDGLVLARGDQRIAVGGSLLFELNSDDPDPAGRLLIEATNVQVGDINQLLLGERKLAGLANGTVVVTGALKAPVVDAELAIVNGSVQDVGFDAIRGTVRFADNRATVNATLDQTLVNHLSIVGTVPIGSKEGAPPEGLDVRVTSTPIHLGIVQAFTTELDRVGGTGSFDLTVTGTQQSPRLNGTVVIDQGAFNVVATGVRYQGMSARFEFDGERLSIASFQLTDPHGAALKVEGGLNVLGETAGTALGLTMTANRLQVLDSKSGTARIDGNLEISGEVGAPRIVGQLRVDQGRIEAADVLERTTKSVYATRPQVPEGPSPDSPPGATVIDLAGAPPPEKSLVIEAPTTSLFDRAEMAIEVDVPDNLVIRGRDLRVDGTPLGLGDTNIVAGGTLALRKAAGGPVTVVGSLEIIRGYYAFQGRRFEVQRESTVRFRGTEVIDPQIDINAVRDISGVEASVRVRGTVREPSVTLSSRPPLDSADILSLIVFGQPVNDLGVSQQVSLAERAGAMAAGAIATPIADSVARALNLDLFEIVAPAGDQRAPVVALGSQIGTRLYVGVRQELGHEESSSVSIEYRIAEFLRLVTSVAQGAMHTRALGRAESGGVDLIFMFRY